MPGKRERAKHAAPVERRMNTLTPDRPYGAPQRLEVFGAAGITTLESRMSRV